MKIAIQGNATRGKEVIQLLEMLGGVNYFNLKGSVDSYFYYIDDSNKIYSCWNPNVKNVIIYNLEEFEEKFSYKVGDKVLFVDIDNIVWEIESIQWVNNEIKYIIRDNNKSRLCDIKAEHLQPYKEQKVIPPYMDYDITTTYVETERTKIMIPEIPQSINLTQSNVNEIEVVLGDYEFILKDGKTYFVKKKPKYPKTYEECCKVLDFCGDYFLTTYDTDDLINKEVYGILQHINSLTRLLICKLAYWKIAGEELGLGKPWEPDWNDVCDKYTIYIVYGNEIWRDKGQTINTLLAFPTMEMRDAFYENFKDLIEQCKCLL